jgi:hypothetical protein
MILGRCCCGCTLLSDTFNRSGSDIGPDGVSPTEVDGRYFFASGSWVIDSNKLKCVTAGETFLFYSHVHCECNTDVRPQVSVTLNALGDYAEMSNATETIRLEIVTGSTGFRALATTFGGTTTYAYGNSSGTSNFSVPTTQTLAIILFHCDPEQPDWNRQLCFGQNDCDDPDYARSSPFVQTISTTIRNDYEWSLKASAGVTFDNLTIVKNTDPCTPEPSLNCGEICCGEFPISIELTISGFDADCEAPCCINREDFDECKSQCASERAAALAVLQAEADAYAGEHGGSYIGWNGCERQEPIEQAYVACQCGCTESNFECKVIGPCASSLNGTHIYEQWTDPIGLSIPTNVGCRYYYCMIPVSAFWQVKADATMGGQYANECFNLEEVSDRYIYSHITLSYRFYDSGSPKRSQITYQLWLSTRNIGGFANGQRSWIPVDNPANGGTYVDSSVWCSGGDMAMDAPSEYADEWYMNTVLNRPSVPSVAYPGTAERPKETIPCAKFDPLPCGDLVNSCADVVDEVVDPDTGETTLVYQDYVFDVSAYHGIQCNGATHVQLSLSLESMGV